MNIHLFICFNERAGGMSYFLRGCVIQKSIHTVTYHCWTGLTCYYVCIFLTHQREGEDEHDCVKIVCVCVCVCVYIPSASLHAAGWDTSRDCWGRRRPGCTHATPPRIWGTNIHTHTQLTIESPQLLIHTVVKHYKWVWFISRDFKPNSLALQVYFRMKQFNGIH